MPNVSTARKVAWALQIASMAVWVIGIVAKQHHEITMGQFIAVTWTAAGMMACSLLLRWMNPKPDSKLPFA
jgi:hypothetical protein